MRLVNKNELNNLLKEHKAYFFIFLFINLLIKFDFYNYMIFFFLYIVHIFVPRSLGIDFWPVDNT